MKIHKGDTVQVIAGKDKGRTGKVLRALPKTLQLIVEGVHVRKKHQRAQKKGQKGQVIDKTHPIHVSNVMLIDPKTNKPTRLKVKVKDGKKVRISKKSGAVI
ncbi:MAG: large subunit ribosomal protein L24 [Parcubacteria group bacterium Gr01-1014_48]|nr:MAG: large subunit ribosomal protein L24 [Parcubacteria group bacterium Greene0416_14]TSC72533.1 MAG: large subunit ribosomal protein L24 [Parcubacteria group bacterium Gr01-1014_48]TSD00587.1 MAG: large subunit ribosomal protein L24 [Parcubacteria group bacterium Greene1014_15]TSD08278.1 MAG: large subunit ribosomal protein L24 [Parcubacteria group bacterium Greene0714_4]